MTQMLNADNIFDSESGYFLSQKHQDLAEVINLYNEQLRVVWIPTDQRTAESPKPFGVACFPSMGEPYIIMLLSEAEMNNSKEVLQRVIASDGKNVDVVKYLASSNDAAVLLREKKKLEERAEMHDRAKSIFRSPLYVYNLGGGRKIRT